MNRIPGNSLGSSNGRFTHAFDAQSRDFIKGGAAVLEMMVRCVGVRAKGLPASPAPVATTLSAPGRVEAVTNDGSGVAFSRGRAVLVGTVETLHGWTSEMPELMAQFESQTIPRKRVPLGLPTLDDGSTAFGGHTLRHCDIRQRGIASGRSGPCCESRPSFARRTHRSSHRTPPRVMLAEFGL